MFTKGQKVLIVITSCVLFVIGSAQIFRFMEYQFESRVWSDTIVCKTIVTAIFEGGDEALIQIDVQYSLPEDDESMKIIKLAFENPKEMKEKYLAHEIKENVKEIASRLCLNDLITSEFASFILEEMSYGADSKKLGLQVNLITILSLKATQTIFNIKS